MSLSEKKIKRKQKRVKELPISHQEAQEAVAKGKRAKRKKKQKRKSLQCP
jgi:hypothetical protein